METIIDEIKKFMNDYDTFYESWLNNEISQEEFHKQRDDRINILVSNLLLEKVDSLTKNILSELRYKFSTISGLIATDRENIIPKDIEIRLDFKKEIKDIDDFIGDLEAQKENEENLKMANPNWLIGK